MRSRFPVEFTVAVLFVAALVTTTVGIPYTVGATTDRKRDEISDQLEPLRQRFIEAGNAVSTARDNALLAALVDPGLIGAYELQLEHLEDVLRQLSDEARLLGFQAEAQDLRLGVGAWIGAVDAYLSAYAAGEVDAGDAILLQEAMPLLDTALASANEGAQRVLTSEQGARSDIQRLQFLEQFVLAVAAFAAAAAALVAAWLARLNRRALARQTTTSAQLRETTMSLQSAVSRLREADSQKDAFLDTVAHELQSPLAIIKGYASILRRRGDTLDKATRDEATHEIERGVERQTRVLQNMLVLARLEHGQGVETEAVDLKRLGETVVEYHRRGHPHRDIYLDAQEDALIVDGHPGYLEQALVNLTSNAEKYSPAETPITIKISRDGESARLSVLDRGPGIAEEEANRLFDPFYRSKRNPRGVGGLGIGLSVVRRVIEAQKGELWIASRDGGGADVGFRLPLSAVAATPSANRRFASAGAR